MNIRRRVLIGSASAAAIICAAAPALAAAASNNGAVDEIVVTGIRESLQKAIQVKKAADDHVDAISATDIGKLPDKNVADALQRIPGVNIASAAAGEGGFDEADRVSIRGTSPSLTQVNIDGHGVASADWFILDQYQDVGRSVSFDLLPSEIVSGVNVYKTQDASQIEGGVAGSVDVLTRRPLEDFKGQYTMEGSFQGAYDTLAASTKPQVNGLIGWKNQDNTFGVLVQGFYEDRTVQRNGQEILGYTTINSVNTPATAAALPNLVGVAAPTLIGSTLFQQEKKRSGIDGSVEWAPNDKFSLRLSGLYTYLNASNDNYNYMYWGIHELQNNVPSSYSVVNNTLVGATFPANFAGPNGPVPVDGMVVDAITRPNANSSTYYANLDGKYNATSNLTFTGQIGYSEGHGNTPDQPSFEVDGAPGVSYARSGNGFAVMPSVTNAQAPTALANDWAWNAVLASLDKEFYVNADGVWNVDHGAFKDVDFGVRFEDHARKVDFWDRGCTLGANGACYGAGPLPYSTVDPVDYPSNYSASELGIPGLVIPIHASPSAVATVINNIPGGVRGSAAVTQQRQNWYWMQTFEVSERDLSGYVMAKVGGDGWRGNFGVRLASTDETANVNVSDPPNTSLVAPPVTPLATPALTQAAQDAANAAVQLAAEQQVAAANGSVLNTSSAYGNYYVDHVKHTYLDILPSANFTFDLQQNLLLRVSAAETMTRPNYSDLGGSAALTNLTLTGNVGNPDLKPIRAAVFDGSLEWYYAPTALAAVSLFYDDFQSYISYANHPAVYFDQLTNSYQTYTMTEPQNTTGQLQGIELQVQQPLPAHFGVQANLTFIDSEAATGGRLEGTSRVTYNLVGYYEQKWGSVRLAYTYRSAYFLGYNRGIPESEFGYGQLDMSANVNITPNIALTFDAKNLTDSLIRYYGANTTETVATYDNGSQFYFGIKAKF